MKKGGGVGNSRKLHIHIFERSLNSGTYLSKTILAQVHLTLISSLGLGNWGVNGGIRVWLWQGNRAGHDVIVCN